MKLKRLISNMKFALPLLISVAEVCAQTGGYGRQAAPGGSFPKLVQRVAEYTTEALDAKPEGSVQLSTIIGTDGILRSGDSALLCETERQLQWQAR